MTNTKHKVFISYYHADDQAYKQALLDANQEFDLFLDWSVDTGEIDERLSDQRIREIIRDDFLRGSTVTIVLVGTGTRYRKHVDWEIYSSMYNGTVNKQSGVLVINLPITNCTYHTAAHGDEEKRILYPDVSSWTTITDQTEYGRRYPHMPARIIDNLMKSEAKISVTNWNTFSDDVERLRFLIDVTHQDSAKCRYELSRPMRRANSATRWS